MTPRNGEKCIHVRWIPEGVNGHDCSSFVRDRRFSPIGIQVEGDRININKDGICSHIANRVGCGDERERRHNDFVPRSNTESNDAEVEGGSSGADANGVGRTVVNGNRLLKFLKLWAQAQTGTALYLGYGFYFRQGYVKCRERNFHADHSGLDVRFRSRSAPKGTEASVSTILSAACPSP